MRQYDTLVFQLSSFRNDVTTSQLYRSPDSSFVNTDQAFLCHAFTVFTQQLGWLCNTRTWKSHFQQNGTINEVRTVLIHQIETSQHTSSFYVNNSTHF